MQVGFDFNPKLKFRRARSSRIFSQNRTPLRLVKVVFKRFWNLKLRQLVSCLIRISFSTEAKSFITSTVDGLIDGSTSFKSSRYKYAPLHAKARIKFLTPLPRMIIQVPWHPINRDIELALSMKSEKFLKLNGSFNWSADWGIKGKVNEINTKW